MVKVKLNYIGDHMENGIYEVSKKKVDGLLETGLYEMPGTKVEKKTNKIINMDLDGDGDFDKDDKSIAAKILRAKIKE